MIGLVPVPSDGVGFVVVYEYWSTEILCRRVIHMYCLILSAGYAEAAECQCDTVYQQCRKQYSCDYYYQTMYVRMFMKRILPGGPIQAAGSDNPCADCVSIL